MLYIRDRKGGEPNYFFCLYDIIQQGKSKVLQMFIYKLFTNEN